MKSRTVKADISLVKGTVISFMVPLAVLLISFAFEGLAPFGERTLCSMDGFSQYYPMLRNMAQSIKEGEFFYSFNGALGFNLWAQSAYYTNSPFWFLLYFLPEEAWFSAINILIAFKLSFASLFFYITVCLKYPKINKNKYAYCFPAVSVAYGLCGYSLAFINQLMWTDIIVLLPLIIFGIEELFKNQKIGLYIFTLFLSMWICFYLSYMVCIFAALYFVFLSLSKKTTFRDFLKKGTLFAVSSVISAGLAAVVLIPVYKALGLTVASELGFEGALMIKHSLFNMIKNLLPFRKPSLEYGAPNLYFGVTATTLVVLFLLSEKISKRKKISAVIFVLFMLFSMSLNLGEFVWHGFHYPNQLPGRQSFLFVFLILSFAADFIAGANIKKAALHTLCGILIFEICLNCVYQVGNNAWTSRIPSLARYDAIMEEFAPIEDKQIFTRIEFADEKKNNCPQQYSYKGITYYSSTMTADAYNFFQQLGQPRYAKNVSVYYLQSDITNALFGISDILTLEVMEDAKGNSEKFYIVEENKRAIPLAFICSDEILSFNLTDHEPGEEAQKALWLALAEDDNASFANQAQQLISQGLEITLYDTDKIKGTVKAEKSSVLMTTIPNDGGWKIYVDGKQAEVLKLADYFCGAIIPQGSHEIEFVYTVPGIKAGAVVSVLSVIAFAVLVMSLKKKDYF